MEIITLCGQIHFGSEFALSLSLSASESQAKFLFQRFSTQYVHNKEFRKIESDDFCALAPLTEANGSGSGFRFLMVTANSFSSKITGGEYKVAFYFRRVGSIKSVPVIVLMPVNVWLAVCRFEAVMTFVLG